MLRVFQAYMTYTIGSYSVWKCDYGDEDILDDDDGC